MEAWRDKLNKYFNGELKLFEENYTITYPCVLKRGRKRNKSKDRYGSWDSLQPKGKRN